MELTVAELPIGSYMIAHWRDGPGKPLVVEGYLWRRRKRDCRARGFMWRRERVVEPSIADELLLGACTAWVNDELLLLSRFGNEYRVKGGVGCTGHQLGVSTIFNAGAGARAIALLSSKESRCNELRELACQVLLAIESVEVFRFGAWEDSSGNCR